MKKIMIIKTQTLDDDLPDLSYLETTLDEQRQIVLSSMRYSNDDVRQFGWEQVKRWVTEDHQRLANYGRSWNCLGIKAVAQIATSSDGKCWLMNRLSSGGLWGIESDSDDRYLEEVALEEAEELRVVLREIGFSDSEIDGALMKSGIGAGIAGRTGKAAG